MGRVTASSGSLEHVGSKVANDIACSSEKREAVELAAVVQSFCVSTHLHIRMYWSGKPDKTVKYRSTA